MRTGCLSSPEAALTQDFDVVDIATTVPGRFVCATISLSSAFGLKAPDADSASVPDRRAPRGHRRWVAHDVTSKRCSALATEGIKASDQGVRCVANVASERRSLTP